MTTDEHPSRRSTDGEWRARMFRLWRSPEFSLLMMFVALALACVAVFILAPQVTRNTRKLDRQQHELAAKEREDNIVQQQTTYRVCARNSVDRAFAHDAVSHGPRGAAEVRHLERVLPILACTPNLHGQPARALSPPLQRRFVQRWVNGELSLGEQGICSVPPTKPYC